MSDRWDLPVSTHSRPKAAAKDTSNHRGNYNVSTHSRPKAAALHIINNIPNERFQHTAARRRLLQPSLHHLIHLGFNTQPPEGGCDLKAQVSKFESEFQHTAARRRLLGSKSRMNGRCSFQHTAARRRLPARRVVQNL